MHDHGSISRRDFMIDFGKGTLAVAVFGMTALACSNEQAETPGTTTAPSETRSPEATSSTTSSTTPPPSATTAPPATEGAAWERINLGFVSAYVLARHGEAAIVDTGVSGSEPAITAGLDALDLDWSDVGHVIITHLHNDHQGSLPAVLGLAADATAYAGTADIPGIESPKPLTGVGDGDTVFGLDIIDTPGHTPGHISVLDPVGGLLVAGDALNGADGGVIGANPQFTSDTELTNESIRKLAAFSFGTIVFGHGEPIVGAASQQVADLAAGLL